MNREPLITIGAAASAIGAFIVMMQAFGVPISDEQKSAIQDFVTIAGPLVIVLIGRQFVFSPAKTEELVDEAYQATPGVDLAPEVKL